MHTQDDLTDGESAAIVHVFGRTTNSPHVLYHRQLQDHTTWTPWEKVDMDVESDHLIPVAYNRRVYLFWPVFEEKPDKEAKLPGPYVQSPEHWQWVKDHETWEDDYESWAADKKANDDWKNQKTHLEQALSDARGMLDEAKKTLDEEPTAAVVLGFLTKKVAQLEKQLQNLGEEPDLGDEPREPSEPQFSIQPTVTNWQIKLAWTEFYQGKWSARRTSTESVVSPFVHATLKQVRKQLGLDEADSAAIGSDDTIVTVYLPEKEKHFFRTTIDKYTGDLVIAAYRRYLHEYHLLDYSAFYLGAGASILRNYERVGSWRLYSGAKVRADSSLYPMGEDFLDFARPAGTDNSFMMFADDKPQALTFMADGAEPLPVLQDIPAAAAGYTVATDHRYLRFSLKPPFQRFVYQDERKTYMASYTLDQPFSPLSTAALADVVLDLSPDDPLIEAVKAAAAESVAETSGAMLSTQWLGKLAGSNSVMTSVFGNLTPFLKFDTFFHPHVAGFMTELYRKGVPGLLARTNQERDNDKNGTNVFVKDYKPGKIVHWQRPREHVDFGAGAYAIYNWELFFHVPMLIAESLSQNQRFAEALEWFHFIFNPTTSSDETSPRRFWNTLPFYNNSQPEKHHIQHLLLALSSNAPELASLRDDVEHQIREWREDPANPHLVARLRITAYQKNVVMKYLDTVINWADILFALDRPETVDEACFLYVLASNILGRRPDIVPSPIKVLPKTYHQLSLKGLDEFSNALVAFENEFPYAPPAAKMVPYAKKTGVSSSSLQANAGIALKSVPQTLYFCIPPNAELLEYWNRVEDRLFKIRHCLNIEGVARQLPLFDPPIDPALLVKARAAGLDPFSVISDLHAPLPSYRFSASLQKALEMASELKSLGAMLLSTIEKKDGERLAALRAGHESAVLKAVRDVRKQQIEEAKQTLEGLHRSKAVVEARRDFYRNIEKISDFEQEHMDALGDAHVFNEIAQGLQAAVSTGFLTPDVQSGTAGSFGSPVLTVKLGGTNLGHAAQALAAGAGMIASQFSHDAQMASIRGGYERRWQEWKHQHNLAEKELAQLNKQIIAAEIRQSIAEKELENHERQIENSAAVEAFLRDKYTNEGLYTWMQGQVSKVFFQAYKLAYDLAKRAERAYRFECGPEASASITFGYWDNLRSGLLSGEKLFLDLKRLEAAHADENRRELEITKHVSLDALALVQLRESGWCEMDLPEVLFDTDHKGHIHRRIRRVGLTIPCTVGAYTCVNCTLTLLSNKIRVKSTVKIGAADPYLEDVDGDDRFVSNLATTQSIVTSQAVNDTGSELTFRDDRYLPFEGAGAISTWRIELTQEKHLRQFDYDTISDVVLHLTYTARDGGAVLRKAALESLEKKISESAQVRLFSARHEFSSEWHRFLKPADSQTNHVLKMELIRERFPFLYRNRQLTLKEMELFLKFKDEVVPPAPGPVLQVFVRSPETDATLDTGSLPSGKFTSNPQDDYAGLPHVAGINVGEALFGNWQLEVRKKDVDALLPDLKRVVPDSNTAEQPLGDLVAALEDIYVVCHYAIGEAVV